MIEMSVRDQDGELLKQHLQTRVRLMIQEMKKKVDGDVRYHLKFNVIN